MQNTATITMMNMMDMCMRKMDMCFAVPAADKLSDNEE